MRIWHTADWHMGHENPKDPSKGVIPYCDRPFRNLKAMHKQIEEGLSMLKSVDLLYVHGDCWLYWSFEQAHEFMRMIPCPAILICGNHDRWGKAKMLRAGFDEVHRFLTIKVNGIDVLLTHDPVVACVKEMNERVVLNGHVHQLWRTFGKCINVGVDVWNFAPVSQDELLPLIMEAANIDWADHRDNYSTLSRKV